MNESIVKTGKVVPINFAGAANNIIHSPDAGRRFVVEKIFLRVNGGQTLTFKSATTALSGPILFVDTDRLSEPQGGPGPLFIGRAAGDDFIITSADAVQVSGWALIGEIA